MFVITATNIKMEFLPAIIVVMMIVIILGALFLIFGHLNMLRDVPGFCVFMNRNFYVAFSTCLLVVWAATVFGIDRLTVWELQPGAKMLVHKRRLSRQVNNYNLEGASADSIEDDVPCHIILGLGAMGDITFRIAVPQPHDIPILNVRNVSSKLIEIQRLIDGGKAHHELMQKR
jgi:hypothetical protein